MRQWDWLMGGLAIILGLTIALSATGNARWLLDLRRPKWLAEKIGANPARIVLATLGLVCVGLGLVILSGWRPPWVQ